MPKLKAIEERFDAQAAQALENLIEDVETQNPVKVTGLTVDLVPDSSDDPTSPAVDVNLTVKSDARLPRPQQGPPARGVNERARRKLR